MESSKIRKHKVLAITYYGRSGSVFLQDLLDSHPHCIGIPGCSIMFISDWYDKSHHKTKAEIINNFCEAHKGLFNPRDSEMTTSHNFHKMGTNQDQEVKIEIQKFKTALDQLLDVKAEEIITLPQFFIALNYAYALSIGRNVNNVDTIVFQLHSNLASRAAFLRNFNTKIIQLVREPVQSIYSHKRHYDDVYVGSSYDFKTIVKQMGIYYAIPGFEHCTKALRLEDLHLAPKETLSKMCKWLGIPWHANLLESTFDGLVWHNLKGATQVQGFNDVVISKKHEDIVSDFDRKRYWVLFSGLYAKWDYKTFGRSWNFFSRFKVEEKSSVMTVIKNRLFLVKFVLQNHPIIRVAFRKTSRQPIPLI